MKRGTSLLEVLEMIMVTMLFEVDSTMVTTMDGALLKVVQAPLALVVVLLHLTLLVESRRLITLAIIIHSTMLEELERLLKPMEMMVEMMFCVLLAIKKATTLTENLNRCLFKRKRFLIIDINQMKT
jgi:hypothetical protein